MCMWLFPCYCPNIFLEKWRKTIKILRLTTNLAKIQTRYLLQISHLTSLVGVTGKLWVE